SMNQRRCCANDNGYELNSPPFCCKNNVRSAFFSGDKPSTTLEKSVVNEVSFMIYVFRFGAVTTALSCRPSQLSAARRSDPGTDRFRDVFLRAGGAIANRVRERPTVHDA